VFRYFNLILMASFFNGMTVCRGASNPYFVLDERGLCKYVQYHVRDSTYSFSPYYAFRIEDSLVVSLRVQKHLQVGDSRFVAIECVIQGVSKRYRPGLESSSVVRDTADSVSIHTLANCVSSYTNPDIGL
jgi:hypothetical protein